MMIKKLIFCIIAAALCIALAGCVGLGDILFGLADLGEESAGDSSSSQTISSSEPDAPVSEEPVTPPSSSMPEESDADEKKESKEDDTGKISLNSEVAAFIGKTNEELRAVNGNVCSVYIMYGGASVADYITRPVAYPFTFWLSGSQEDMMNAWTAKSDAEGNAPDENIWPDSFTVGLIEAYGDSISTLLGTTGAVSYAMLEELSGQSPELEFTAAYEGIDYGYEFDTWTASFEIDGFALDCIFQMGKEGHEAFIVRLSPMR